jgi:murein DD-endopeptidase MepM/ murein hydrolase activator NlpD
LLSPKKYVGWCVPVLAVLMIPVAYHFGASLPGSGEQNVSQLASTWRLPRLLVAPADDTLLMPVQGASVRHVADTWLAPRPGGRQHKGQDIFAPRGTPVRSATEGMVTYVGENDLGGKVMFILGAGGRTYYYAHLDRHGEGLSVGDVVTANTVIGYVGNTGNARTTSPHLHFAIFGTDGAIDPLPLLRDRKIGARGREET